MKNDDYYVEKIIFDLDYIIENMSGKDYDDFFVNSILQDSMMFRLIQISENSKRLSEDYKTSNFEVPWNDMIGLRNRIVHDYGNVDLTVIYDTLKYDIPKLRGLIKC